MGDNSTKVAKSYTLEIHHIAMINSHAKHNGVNSSEALRSILDQWALDRADDADQAYQEAVYPV